MAAPSIAQLEAPYREALKRLSRRKGVTAIDIGFRWRGGRPTSELAVRVHVEEKIDPTLLRRPSQLPDAIQGVRTDVIQAIPATPDEATRRRRRNPVIPGISVGRSESESAGTVGMIAYRRDSGAAGILSNWHVLCGPDGRLGDWIRQPANEDGGSEFDEFARLTTRVLESNADAAFAQLTDDFDRPVDGTIAGTDSALQGVTAPSLGAVLEKSGRTTGLTTARIDGIGRYWVRYEDQRRGIDGFRLLPVDASGPICGPGDSGSVWFDSSLRGVGLHVAGDDAGRYAIACDLPRVLERLELTHSPDLNE